MAPLALARAQWELGLHQAARTLANRYFGPIAAGGTGRGPHG